MLHQCMTFYISNKIAALSFYCPDVVGAECQQEVNPKPRGQDLLLACSLFHQMAALYRPQYNWMSINLSNWTNSANPITLELISSTN
jgi:hypothetical protein